MTPKTIPAALALLAGCATDGPTGSTGKVASVPAGVPAIESNVARQGYFYAGGRYVGEPDRQVMVLVRGIVAVEPSGPPFEGAVLAKGPARAWGPTDIRITYDPPVNDPKELAREKQTSADGADLVLCTQQAGKPRTLPNLRGIPIAIITGEASYHAPYDHCTSKYLAQAGVANEHIRLEARHPRQRARHPVGDEQPRVGEDGG